MSKQRDLRQRLEILETQAAFQEELLARLDEVVSRQDGEMIEFRRQLSEVATRLRHLGEAVRQASTQADSADEAPPHY